MTVRRRGTGALRVVLAAGAAAAAAVWGASHAVADAPRNLWMTDDVRAQLVHAGATHKQLPDSDFVGLAPGQTYYAVDPTTGVHWAAARLVPAPDATQAQVADQDAGSYLLFEQSAAGVWTAYNDGTANGARCPAPLPVSIVVLWSWDAEHCRPPFPH